MQALANEVIRVRINEQLKHEANEVLESIGLTMSDAIRIFLKRVVDEKALPFVLKMPRHLDASQMSKEEFDSRMERSFVTLRKDGFSQWKRFCETQRKNR